MRSVLRYSFFCALALADGTTSNSPQSSPLALASSPEWLAGERAASAGAPGSLRRRSRGRHSGVAGAGGSVSRCNPKCRSHRQTKASTRNLYMGRLRTPALGVPTGCANMAAAIRRISGAGQPFPSIPMSLQKRLKHRRAPAVAGSVGPSPPEFARTYDKPSNRETQVRVSTHMFRHRVRPAHLGNFRPPRRSAYPDPGGG